ncbi:MAG: CotH kinase family protein [Bacteroidales bacterium]|nr:CotH kinase family protein [Bacteroidales bacterium]
MIYKRHRLLLLFASVLVACSKEKTPEIPDLNEDETTETAMTRFAFLQEDNPQLTEDKAFTIEDDRIDGYLPLSGNDLKLIPSFNFEGVYVEVEGKTQSSGRSWQDFSRPVTYIVHGKEGDRKAYTVTAGHDLVLPAIHLFTDGNRPVTDKENYVSGSVRFEDPDGIYSEVGLLECQMGIRGRGNTTWEMPKKPWKIKLSEKNPVFGISKSKDWALLANYSDKTLLRNITAMEMSRICEMAWTPQMKSARVYFNGDYQGVYTLSEHKEVSKHKVDIDPDAGDVYLEIDSNLDGARYFTTRVGIPIVFKDPENPSDDQSDAIRDYFSAFETALYSSDFDDPNKGYARYIDIDSFINYFIVAELSKNIDGNIRKSSFLTKERDGKLTFYHLWDFDLAFGNCDYFNYFPGADNGPEGWFVRYYIESGRSDGWYGRMFCDKAFTDRLKERWNTVRDDLGRIPDFIDRSVKELYGAEADNFKRWPILNLKVWPNPVVTGSYQGEVQYLKDYYSQRFQWLDKEINRL